MRVIAGTARGTRLKAPKGFAVRPTADRVKEALFSILGHRIIDAFFIDLYAGSGAIGIEALSRGASYCIFVDNRKENIALISDNLSKARLESGSRVVMADAQSMVQIFAGENIKADLIYLDPPYHNSDLYMLVNTILSGELVAGNGLIIVEHASTNQQWTKEFTLSRQKVYGDTCLSFITPPESS